ncbi:CaiB/BaiF CoA transferase family protein [Halalkalibacter oceani]|uniref:CaiB/BaiF CoA transferase family protein n=1 Tax=Halalkalibacter oceani TaxID=1653776 RepID=UPI0033991E27
MLPLEGITVVSVEQAIAAPFASRHLADLGARVIKVERPEGGDFARNYDKTVKGLSSHFVWCNRSKESLTLDLKSAEGKDVLVRLLKKADVFLHNLAPGAMERLGFGDDFLKNNYPRLIACSISGYGKSGSYKNKKAYDLLIQCEAGLLSITGTDEVPSKAGIPVADISAGLYAFSGILSALIERNQTGKGKILDVSMLESLAEWMGYPMYYAGYSGEEPKRTGANHATIYPYGHFLCGDGKEVFFAIQNEREWGVFCAKLLQTPKLAEDSRFENNPSRFENQAQLKTIIEEAFSTLTSDEVIGRLEESKIANARMNTMKELFHHPQLAERNRWRNIDTPVGSVKMLIPPVTMEGFEPSMKAIPELGEHNEKILHELDDLNGNK